MTNEIDDIDDDDDEPFTPEQQLADALAAAEFEKELNGRTLEQYELDLEKEQIAKAKAYHDDPETKAFWAQFKKIKK